MDLLNTVCLYNTDIFFIYRLAGMKKLTIQDLNGEYLVTLPLETDYTLPYGLMYTNESTAATKKLIRTLKEI